MSSVFSQYAWLVPAFPVAAFAILTALGRSLSRAGAVIATIASLASFILSLIIAIERIGQNAEDYVGGIDWLRTGAVNISAGYEVTNLTSLMLVVVTLVALLVNLYSFGYMAGDGRISVFYAYVALFTASMLGLVLADNLAILYICWELVGVCSFLLIGFWYQKPEARAAAKKAFIVTRVGDLGLLIAILLLFWYMPGHALDFASIHNVFDTQSGIVSMSITTLIALLIFVGAVGKSGQFPLHVWLPDAMEGPTPISALIHAATMVAAGVFLVVRTFDIFEASSAAMTVVAVIGAFTAIFAATIGLAQNDIKRILAYSTVSQLGYMMLALGVGSVSAAMFHLFTHAFFKALLFLGAGSVIHAIHTQDIREMGGLGRRMKVTAWTFGIGALALSGIPPFSGFWSKEAILTAALEGDHPWLFIVGVVTAFFTALYMARLFFLAFAGKPRGNAEQAAHAKESPAVMTIPMIVLAALAVVSGFVQTPFKDWLGEWLTGEASSHGASGLVLVASIAASLLGLYLGWLAFVRGTLRPDAVSSRLPWLSRLLERKYYIDELYQLVFAGGLRGLGRALAVFDEAVVDGAVRLTGYSVRALGRLNTKLQNGQIQTYGLAAILAAVILVLAIAGRRFW
ncbi:NADH-quinone oxidoreductase subunit L [Cohnella lubricantis]|uniref:NADH-quinone oxidoreductase subunit L n=1 Tax=Cohnella lubricantis TaxID=2163172 RepID=A0A841TEU7_9BACL|nr:NADH-quinone oxidoreductase subunit L [Cohnella lubricantis]MBB6679552.1 NADH-quinone oxidoreductase subunit L [Cohnella lubricantis]MBP2117826.1 NADH-quinone oxidoreductase subunit L [Cohnella lubricantis]